MVTSIGSSATSSNGAQIAALEKQLAKYQKELQQDENPGSGSSAAVTQLVATQITLVETEIAQLSDSSALASASSSSTLGKNLNVTA